MNRSTLKQLVALAGLAMVAAPMVAQLSAVAAPAGFMAHKDSKGNVYVGGSPNSEVQVTLSGLEQTRNLKVNACGLAIIKNSSTKPLPASFKVGLNTITPASLPTQLLPKCGTNGQLEESRTANFKTSIGDVVFVGATPNGTIQMTLTDSKIQKVRTNLCGIGRITNSQTKPFASSVIFAPPGDSAKSYGSIPVKLPYLCSKDGTTYAPMVSGGS